MYETRQVTLLAQALATLAEAHVGTAGHLCTQGSGDQAQHMRLGESYVERSREGQSQFPWSLMLAVKAHRHASFQYMHRTQLTTHAVYAGIEDRSGMLECLIMKSQLARWRNDDASVAQADALYVQLIADGPGADDSISTT